MRREFWRRKKQKQIWVVEVARVKGKIKNWRLIEKFTEKAWRMTRAINFVVHRKYGSCICQVAIEKTKDNIEDEEDYDFWNTELIEHVIECVIHAVGYTPEDWWFNDQPNMEDEEMDLLDVYDILYTPRCRTEWR